MFYNLCLLFLIGSFIISCATTEKNILKRSTASSTNALEYSLESGKQYVVSAFYDPTVEEDFRGNDGSPGSKVYQSSLDACMFFLKKETGNKHIKELLRLHSLSSYSEGCNVQANFFCEEKGYEGSVFEALKFKITDNMGSSYYSTPTDRTKINRDVLSNEFENDSQRESNPVYKKILCFKEFK